VTVRVIEPKPDPSVVKRIVCSHCGVTLEYVPNDIKERKYTCMGDPSGHTYVECAQCGKDAVIRSW